MEYSSIQDSKGFVVLIVVIAFWVLFFIYIEWSEVRTARIILLQESDMRKEGLINPDGYYLIEGKELKRWKRAWWKRTRV